MGTSQVMRVVIADAGRRALLNFARDERRFCSRRVCANGLVVRAGRA
jgi:hypothetical protein